MNSVSEALNTLISAVNVAHNKGGVYSLEEAHYIHLAISYLNSLQQPAQPAQAPQSTPAPAPTQEYQGDTYVEQPTVSTDDSPQGY